MSPVVVGVAVATLAMAGLTGCVVRRRATTVPIGTSIGGVVTVHDEIGATMARASGGIDRCVRGRRVGALYASVIFAPRGTVSSVEVQNWSALTDTVGARSCVERVLRRLEIAPFDGKDLHVHVSYDLW
jgi:hypothetical protein